MVRISELSLVHALTERAWQGPAGSKGAKPEEGHATVPGDDLPGITVIKEVAFFCGVASICLVGCELVVAGAGPPDERQTLGKRPPSFAEAYRHLTTQRLRSFPCWRI